MNKGQFIGPKKKRKTVGLRTTFTIKRSVATIVSNFIVLVYVVF